MKTKELPPAKSPISERYVLHQKTPSRNGWELAAQGSSHPREVLLPAETRIREELPVVVFERDGRLSYTADSSRTKGANRFTIDTLLTLNQSPFANVDAIGNPKLDTQDHEHGKRIRHAIDKGLKVRDVTNYMRDAMRAVYKPKKEPLQPGIFSLGLSFIPGISHFQDIWALFHMKSAFGKIRRPNYLKDDVFTIALDYVSLGFARPVKGALHLFAHNSLPLPGSVWMNKHAMYVDNRVYQQYLPQAARRQLETVTDPTHLNKTQWEMFKSASVILNNHGDEVVKLQNATINLLKKAGISGSALGQEFAERNGAIYLSGVSRSDLTQAEVQSIVDQSGPGKKLSYKEVNNMMAGLDMLDLFKLTFELAPQIVNSRRQPYSY